MRLSVALKPKMRTRFAAVLNGSFPHGFKLGSVIDKERFKEFYSLQFGNVPEQSDEEFLKMVSVAGHRRNDKIFPCKGSDESFNFLERVTTEIKDVFQSGANCVFFSEVFRRYRRELVSRLSIFTMEMLRDILIEKLVGEFLVNASYVYLDPEADFSNDIINLLSSSFEPMTCEDMHRILWFVPLREIKKFLGSSRRPEEILCASKGRYFYAPNLPVPHEESKRIEKFINSRLSQYSFVASDELRKFIAQSCPETDDCIELFSECELCSIFINRLNKKLSCSGTIISRNSLNKAEVFEEFCKTRDELTLSELKFVAGEMHASGISWDAVFGEMIRVSKEVFINKRNVNFNVTEIDRVLNETITSDYLPLRKFNMFLHLPAVGFSWNKFLLESYIAGYSWDFTLMHSGYSEGDCYGSIVRRNCGIEDFQGVLTEALASSEAWQSEDEALTFLRSEGYIPRKGCVQIGSVICDANHVRLKNLLEV